VAGALATRSEAPVEEVLAASLMGLVVSLAEAHRVAARWWWRPAVEARLVAVQMPVVEARLVVVQMSLVEVHALPRS